MMLYKGPKAAKRPAAMKKPAAQTKEPAKKKQKVEYLEAPQRGMLSSSDDDGDGVDGIADPTTPPPLVATRGPRPVVATPPVAPTSSVPTNAVNLAEVR